MTAKTTTKTRKEGRKNVERARATENIIHNDHFFVIIFFALIFFIYYFLLKDIC